MASITTACRMVWSSSLADWQWRHDSGAPPNAVAILWTSAGGNRRGGVDAHGRLGMAALLLGKRLIGVEGQPAKAKEKGIGGNVDHPGLREELECAAGILVERHRRPFEVDAAQLIEHQMRQEAEHGADSQEQTEEQT